MNWIVNPQSSANRKRKQCAEHTHCACGRAASASHSGKPVLAGLHACAVAPSVHTVAKFFDIRPSNRGDLERAQEWFDVSFDARLIATSVAAFLAACVGLGCGRPGSPQDRCRRVRRRSQRFALPFSLSPGRRRSPRLRESSGPRRAPYRASRARRGVRSSPNVVVRLTVRYFTT